MANSRPVSNDSIYKLVNDTRLEVKSDIAASHLQLSGDLNDLRRQFETLEAGRLTALERRMNDFVVAQSNKDGKLSQNQAVLSTKILTIWSIGGAIFMVLSEFAVNRLLK